MAKRKRKKILTLSERNKIKTKVTNQAFRNIAEAIVGRSMLAESLGKSYWSSDGSGAQRDLYKALGYKINLTYNDYFARYKRQEIANTIVTAPVEQTWKLKPRLVDQKEAEDSQFEKEWNQLVKEKKIWHYLSRIDKLSGIGRFGILFLGVNDGKDPEEPLEKVKGKNKRKLLYLRPYSEGNVSIQKWEEDINNERYGLPKIYQVEVTINQGSTQTKTIDIHHSRVIHISEGLLSDDIYGTPRLQKIFNRLQDIELVAGGSAEMFWRGALPGYAFSAREDAQFDPDDLDDLEDEIQEYLHELRRYIRLQGIDVKDLSVQIESPKDHFDVLVTLIAAGTRIPKRILLGSERGELASSQDERAWLDRIDSRRVDYVEPTILRPFVDKCIKYGILSEPKGEEGYEVEWPMLFTLDPRDEAEVKKALMEIVAKYVSTPGASELIPEDFFLRKWMNMSQDDIDEIERLLKEMEKYVSKEEGEIEEEGNNDNNDDEDLEEEE